MIVGHGGNIYSVAKQLGCTPKDIIDMSSNVNPLGPLPGMMDHIVDHLEDITALPDAAASMVSDQFANTFQIDTSQILAGNGSTQFIYSLPLALNTKRALIIGPTYADYADACEIHGSAYHFIYSREDNNYVPDIDLIIKEANNYDTVFICNPNNPTGILIPQEDIIKLCKSNPDTWFIVDESYLPFVREGEEVTLIHKGLENVIVLNSMSKIFRIPGLRVGFLISQKRMIKKITRYMLPWSVNSVAQAAVNYLMTHPEEVDEFISKTQKVIRVEREHMTNQLNNQENLHLFPSTTGFILAKILGDMTSKYVYEELIKEKILIRDCSNFRGLSDRYFRISLKNSATNNVLIEKLKTFFR